MRWLLDGVVAMGVVLLLVVLSTGGVTLVGVSITRAEDVLVAVVALAALRAIVDPWRLPAISPGRVVVVGILAYVILMGFVVSTRHHALRTHALDLGYYVQLVWNIAEGNGARVTLPPMHAWGDHFSPIFYGLAPLGRLAPGGTSLVLLQTVVLAAGALAVYGYGRRYLGPASAASAATLALLYLLNPSLHGINIRDLHPQAFAIPLVITAALAFDARRPLWCAVALVLTLATREDAAIAVMGFGVWLALARRRRALGAAVAAASAVVLAVDLWWLMPHFREGPYPHLHRWMHLGTSLPDILVTIVARPWRWVPVVLTTPKLLYLAALLAPLAFLPLLAPRTAAAALPGLAMNLLSLDPRLFHHRSQYQALVLPFLVLAAVEGYRSLQARAGERRAPRRVSPGAALATAAFVSLAMSARTVNDLMVTRWRLGPDQQTVHAMMRRIPPAAPVSVNERLVPHLAARPEVYVFPTGVERSQWVLERAEGLAARPPAGFIEIERGGGTVLLRRE